MTSTPADESILETFRAAQKQRLRAIAEIRDALSSFQLLLTWIDQIALHYNGSPTYEANWRAFIRSFFPAHYHPGREIKRLYRLRGALLHQLGTRDVLLTEGDPQNHWMEQSGLRVVHLPTLLADCEAAWRQLSDEIAADPSLRAAVVARVQGINQPVRIATVEGTIAASASATSLDLEAMGWNWPLRDKG